ncbi:AI-2E family transporter [Microbulbifer magnicolonia]|uniref:AI-2E family transporter n=1 Tax=Microbulbifer magnicolonia TaxID=3109744 RepID=UPI002B414965|nr:AI-2E family transporter [Microbulbifer sp. GG15]
MDAPENNRRAFNPSALVDIAVRLALVALLAWLAARAFAPFLTFMLWALVLAISLYPLNRKLASAIGTTKGRAACILVLLMLLLLGVPTVLLGVSFIDHTLGIYKGLSEGSVVVPAPKPSIEEWPLVGEQLYAAWQAASKNFDAFAHNYEQQLRSISREAAAAVGGTLAKLLAFVGAFIVAGIMLAYAAPGEESSRRIFTRVCGPKFGPELLDLSVATVRSVTSGVIGVAFIQAVLLGIGFLLGGVPAAGLLAIVALLLGIAQIPAILIVIPVLAWIWMGGDGSTRANTLVTIYLLVAGLADNVLKPLLLGRGLAVPMPVVLLGAIGGMISAGLIGLFVGAVTLALAYQIFRAWVYGMEPARSSDPGADTDAE